MKPNASLSRGSSNDPVTLLCSPVLAPSDQAEVSTHVGMREYLLAEWLSYSMCNTSHGDNTFTSGNMLTQWQHVRTILLV